MSEVIQIYLYGVIAINIIAAIFIIAYARSRHEQRKAQINFTDFVKDVHYGKYYEDQKKINEEKTNDQ